MFNVDRRITMVVLLAAFGAPPTMAQEAARPPSELAASSRTRPGIISTHAESLRRLPNTVSDASVGIGIVVAGLSLAFGLLNAATMTPDGAP